MKPRQDPAPLTAEDEFIWFRVCIRMDPERLGSCRSNSIDSDHRDADLMLKAQQQREWLEVEDGSCGPDFCLPPWFMPFEWECGPVGGDITRYITNGA